MALLSVRLSDRARATSAETRLYGPVRSSPANEDICGGQQFGIFQRQGGAQGKPGRSSGARPTTRGSAPPRRRCRMPARHRRWGAKQRSAAYRPTQRRTRGSRHRQSDLAGCLANARAEHRFDFGPGSYAARSQRQRRPMDDASQQLILDGGCVDSGATPSAADRRARRSRTVPMPASPAAAGGRPAALRPSGDRRTAGCRNARDRLPARCSSIESRIAEIEDARCGRRRAPGSYRGGYRREARPVDEAGRRRRTFVPRGRAAGADRARRAPLRGDGDRHAIAPFHRDIGPSVLGRHGPAARAIGALQALEHADLVRDHGHDAGGRSSRD